MKSILKLLVLCVSVNVSAQDSQSGILKVDKPQEPIVVAPQILIYNCDNLLHLLGDWDSKKQIEIKISQGWVNLSDDGKYIAHPVEVGEAVVSVVKDGKTIKEIPYRVRRLPDPKPTVGGRYVSGVIGAMRLSQETELTAELSDWFPNTYFEIVSFDFTLRAKDADLVSLKTSGGQFTTMMSQLLRGAKAGDAVFFDNIKAMGCDELERKLPGLAFEIK